MRFYLDANILVSLFHDETATSAVVEWIQDRSDLLVSDFARAEFSASLARLERIEFLNGDARMAVEREFGDWLADNARSVSQTGDDIAATIPIVGMPIPAIRVPDAIHLTTCMRLGATLVTNDRALARAAGHYGISVQALG